MKPAQLTQIIIRLFAISWFLYGITQTVAIFTMNSLGKAKPVLFLPGGAAIILAFVAWLLAPKVGQWISQGSDQEEIPAAITFQQLLNAMFVGIGLYYSLGSVSGLINSLYFFLVLRAIPASIPAGMHLTAFDLSKSAITFVAGIFLIASAPHWARRLSK